MPRPVRNRIPSDEGSGDEVWAVDRSYDCRSVTPFGAAWAALMAAPLLHNCCCGGRPPGAPLRYWRLLLILANSTEMLLVTCVAWSSIPPPDDRGDSLRNSRCCP